MGLSDLPLKYEERILFQLRRLYRQYGYTQYHMSKFEEYELYARNKNFLVSEHILTFTDTDGRLLALKPDVTLSILKNSQSGGTLQKVYYNENVYRTAPASHGYREIMQAGLECIGDLDACAICEVVELAARSLETIRADYLLDLSHMGIVSGLLDAMDWTDREGILGLVAEKNAPAIRALCRERGVSGHLTALLCELVGLYGTPAQVLPALERMAVNGTMTRTLAELRQVCTVLEPFRDNLRLDFSIVNDMNYYNGVIFRGYLPGLASGVLAGGQYDRLLHRMGRPGQAIGFAVYMDQLERFEPTACDYDVDVLLLCREGADPRRVCALANELRGQEKTVRVERGNAGAIRCRECMEVE